MTTRSKQRRSKTTKRTPVRYPLFKINRGDSVGFLWVIAQTPSEALAKAQVIWKLKRLTELTDGRNVTVEHSGSVDYIPALKRPHWELPATDGGAA